MSRFGKLFLALLLLAGIGFATMVKVGASTAARDPGVARRAPAGVGAAPVAPVAPVSPAAQSAVPLAGGALAIPVAGVRPAALVDSFADPRGTGRIHGAIDIMAARGTAVLAAAGGTIEKIFESRLGGHTLYIRSPDRQWVYYYAHLDRYADDLREGLYVPAGRVIAAVGATGDASAEGPHLHFEVKQMGAQQRWYEGQDVNPYPLLRGR